MIRNAGSKYDNYSISSKIRQILLHWGYKLTKERFWAIKLIYNNERFNKIWERSIRNKNKSLKKYCKWKWEWEMRMRNENENEKWEWEWEMKNKNRVMN